MNDDKKRGDARTVVNGVRGYLMLEAIVSQHKSTKFYLKQNMYSYAFIFLTCCPQFPLLQ